MCMPVCMCVYKWGVWEILGCRLFSAGGCVGVHSIFFLCFVSPRRSSFHQVSKLKVGVATIKCTPIACVCVCGEGQGGLHTTN